MKKRNTLQKKIVLDATKKYPGHPTADDVFSFIKTQHPGISRATVFRNLKSLSEDNIITKIQIPAGADRYDAVADGHHHGICYKCNNIFDLGFEPNVNIDISSNEFKDKDIDNYVILFKGVCNSCMAK